MKNIGGKIANVLFLTSLFLLIFLTTILVFSSILFILNLSISKVSAVISIVLSFGIYYFLALRKKEFSLDEIIAGNILGIILIFIALFLCTTIYDFAWDSNWYHKSALGCMKLGWNPLYQKFEDFIQTTDMCVGTLKGSQIWAQHYCKASWIVGANIYTLTNNIETGKVVNLLMAFVLLGFSYHYLVTRLKKWQTIIVLILMVFNPIVSTQVFTLYVDNLLMTNLFGILILLFAITDEKYQLSKWYKYSALIMLVTFCINIKFTGLAYAGIFCFLFFCIWCIKAFFDWKLKKTFKKNILFYIIGCSVAVLIVGASSYLTNFINKGHPLYPLAGQEKIDIMSSNQPDMFAELSTTKKLFISIFAETSNDYSGKIHEIKPLFSVTEEEIEQCGYDTRVGGFGPLFGGILVISLGVILCGLIILYRRNKYWFAVFTSVLVVILLMLSLITESWWARYSPYLYVIPVLAVIFLFVAYNESKVVKKIILAVVMVFLTGCMLLNTSYFAKYILECKVRTDIAKEEMKGFSMTPENKLEINFIHGTLAGIEFNFRDYDINYEIVDRTENVGRYTYGGLVKIEN